MSDTYREKSSRKPFRDDGDVDGDLQTLEATSFTHPGAILAGIQKLVTGSSIAFTRACPLRHHSAS